MYANATKFNKTYLYTWKNGNIAIFNYIKLNRKHLVMEKNQTNYRTPLFLEN